jgi:hypothetical protein
MIVIHVHDNLLFQNTSEDLSTNEELTEASQPTPIGQNALSSFEQALVFEHLMEF